MSPVGITLDAMDVDSLTALLNLTKPPMKRSITSARLATRDTPPRYRPSPNRSFRPISAEPQWREPSQTIEDPGRACNAQPLVRYFNGERRRATWLAAQLFDHRLPTDEYALLIGAPGDAVVEVGVLEKDLYLEMHQPWSRGYFSVCRIGRRRQLLELSIDALHVAARRTRQVGLGLTIVARQLGAASSLGIARACVHAGRRPGENGYYSWPRFGFDGPIPDSLRPTLPQPFRHAETVMQIMQADTGRAWWRRHGVALPLAFDLRPESPCWKTLGEYLCSRSRNTNHPWRPFVAVAGNRTTTTTPTAAPADCRR